MVQEERGSGRFKLNFMFANVRCEIDENSPCLHAVEKLGGGGGGG